MPFFAPIASAHSVMPSNTRSACECKQHAVLERAGLAFVGIAHHIVRPALGVAASLPFHAGGKSGAAASAQLRRFQLFDQLLRSARARRGQRFTGRELAAEQHVLAPHLVLDPEVFARPSRERDLVADQFADFVHALPVKAGDRVIVHQQRRSLVAHAGAGGSIHAHQTILRRFAALDPQLFAHALQQFHVS